MINLSDFTYRRLFIKKTQIFQNKKTKASLEKATKKPVIKSLVTI